MQNIELQISLSLLIERWVQWEKQANRRQKTKKKEVSFFSIVSIRFFVISQFEVF